MKLIKSKKGVALLATLAVAVIAAVGAYAYFSTTGAGSGSAKVGTATDFTVATDAYTGGPLTPGGASGTYESVKYRVTNPSSGNQNLSNVNIKVANSNGSAWTSVAGCSASDFQLSVDGGTTWGAAGASVNDTSINANLNPGATSSDGTITIRMVDSGSNQDGCKNATVPLYLFAS